MTNIHSYRGIVPLAATICFLLGSFTYFRLGPPADLRAVIGGSPVDSTFAWKPDDLADQLNSLDDHSLSLYSGYIVGDFAFATAFAGWGVVVLLWASQHIRLPWMLSVGTPALVWLLEVVENIWFLTAISSWPTLPSSSSAISIVTSAKQVTAGIMCGVVIIGGTWRSGNFTGNAPSDTKR